MYSKLKDAMARKAKDAFLHKALNECRPESGVYLAAKHELARRQDVSKNLRKVWVAVLLGLIGLASWWLRG